MKKKFLTLGIISATSSIMMAQVGINTPTPTATLDVTAKNATGTTSNVDGLLVPRVDRQRAQSMTGVPTSTLVFINSIGTGTQTGTTVNVDATGYYYFNGTVWTKLNSAASTPVNIYNVDGTLTENRVVTQNANTLAFNGTATNAFSVDGSTFSVDAANNRIGLGTTTPSNKIDMGTDFGVGMNDVQGKKLALFNNAAGNYFYGFGVGAAALQFHTASPQNGAPKMVLMESGNLGIGTTAPNAKLDVQGNMILGTANTASGSNFSSVVRDNSTGELQVASGTNIFAPKVLVGGTITDMLAPVTVNVATGTSTFTTLSTFNFTLDKPSIVDFSANINTSFFSTSGTQLTDGVSRSMEVAFQFASAPSGIPTVPLFGHSGVVHSSLAAASGASQFIVGTMVAPHAKLVLPAGNYSVKLIGFADAGNAYRAIFGEGGSINSTHPDIVQIIATPQ